MQAFQSLSAAFLAGTGIGAIYLFLLWISTRRLARVNHPGTWMAGLLALRMVALLAGFYFIARFGRWTAAVAALGGLLLVRFIVLQRVKNAERDSARA